MGAKKSFLLRMGKLNFNQSNGALHRVAPQLTALAAVHFGTAAFCAQPGSESAVLEGEISLRATRFCITDSLKKR